MSNKAIFFDRDDTLIQDFGFINSPDQIKLLDGVAEGLVELKGRLRTERPPEAKSV